MVISINGVIQSPTTSPASPGGVFIDLEKEVTNPQIFADADAVAAQQAQQESFQAQTESGLGDLEGKLSALETDSGPLDVLDSGLSEALSVVLDSDIETISATDLNAAAAGAQQEEFDVEVRTSKGTRYDRFSAKPVIAVREFIVDADVGAPTLDGLGPVVSEGSGPVRHTWDTDAGATKTYAAGTAATGSIDCDSVGTGVLPADTEEVVIDDGINPAVTFRVNLGTPVTETATLREVDLNAAVDEDDVKNAFISAINGAPALLVTASDGGAGIVSLVHERFRAAGNVAITETVTEANFTVTGMAGGVDGCVEFDVDLTASPLISEVKTKVYNVVA